MQGNAMDVLVVQTNVLGKLFGSIFSIELTNPAIIINYKNGSKKEIAIHDIIYFPILINSFFGNSLIIKHKDGEEVLNLLSRPSSINFHKIISLILKEIFTNQIQHTFNLFKKYCIDNYLRDSEIHKISIPVNNIIHRYNDQIDIWNSFFSTNIQLKILYEYHPITSKKSIIRENYEKNTLKNRKSFYDMIESKPLTDQQRYAVIRNDDFNLVLAAAGTGKTSVIVAKALDLIASGKATEDEVLILAYNKAAAQEISERINARCKSINMNISLNVSTFHALGRNILKTCKIPTHISIFAEDEKKLELWLSNWFIEYIKNNTGFIFRFLYLSYQPINPFDFKTKSEYDSYVRDNEYRTLNNIRVRGYQELIIANWLYMHGISYEYEPLYFKKIRIEAGFDYRPDFFLTDYNIYLEHFGINRNGSTRPDIDRVAYNNTINEKRKLHQEHKTKLIETYHYDWVEGQLEKRLEILMQENQVKINRISDDDIFKALQESNIFINNIKRYLKCLQAIRVERLDDETVLNRLKNAKIFFAESYAKLLNQMHAAYKEKLLLDQTIDFDDMIIRSTEAIESGQYLPTWKYILVDEFQDISMARMQLVQSIIKYGPNPVLTVVGDDWQSIYRFSGGKLELTTRFGEIIGPHSITKLEKTYRYNNSIADIAGTFVMKNPEQYRKQVITDTQVDTPQVYLIDAKQDILETTVHNLIRNIRENDSKGSIAILARYRYLLKDISESLKSTEFNNDIKFWTFHGSKGLEADYCILVGFTQGKLGFPNQNKEEAVVEALLPSLDTFPHSEERRLFYVGITRAKKKSYLIADPMATSPFVLELLSPQYKLNITSHTFEEKYRSIFKCHECTDGYFKLFEGNYGKFYKCTSGSICRSKPRICSKCGSPSVDTKEYSICNNPNCREKVIICNRCGRPMKQREGKYGKFWGCSGYGIPNDQCKNTRKW